MDNCVYTRHGSITGFIAVSKLGKAYVSVADTSMETLSTYYSSGHFE
jgi:hypothetical protein